jgi:hypothetical protein
MENASRNEFYRAAVNNSNYHPVCEYKVRRDAPPTNVINAFKGLQCSEPELYQWNTKRSEYTQQFKKAKQCLERRLTRMKKYGATTNQQRETRKRHAYPIKVAYTFGKDCLKKMGSQRQRNIFETSVNDLVDTIAETKPDVKNYFGNSIEQSIRESNNDSYLKELLDKTYYSPDIQGVINKERNSGLYRLSQSNQDLYKSIFNEGFERNVEFLRLLEEPNNENEAENARNETTIRPAAITLRRRALRKKKKTLKRQQRQLQITNVRNLNTILNSNEFIINDEGKKKVVKDLINKITDIYKSSVYLGIKNSLILQITNSIIMPEKYDLVSKKYMEAQNEISGITGKTGRKDKKAKKADEFLSKTEVKLFRKFTDIIESLDNTVIQNTKKIDKLREKVNQFLRINNANIKREVDAFYNKFMNEHLLEIVYKEIEDMSDEEFNKSSDETTKLFDSVIKINVMSTELNILQLSYEIIPIQIIPLKSNIENIQRRIDVLHRLKDAIKNRPNKLASTNANLKELLEIQEKQMKELTTLIESKKTIIAEYFELYKSRNEILDNINSEISKGIVNPLILRKYLETRIFVKELTNGSVAPASNLRTGRLLALTNNPSLAGPAASAAAAATVSNV